jgi:hypothetical protein
MNNEQLTAEQSAAQYFLVQHASQKFCDSCNVIHAPVESGPFKSSDAAWRYLFWRDFSLEDVELMEASNWKVDRRL